ncbi:MAG TPA: diguanylate cyclase [Solimonas sp.]|nr:diguanylate cyclase [Solimonas sp.]
MGLANAATPADGRRLAAPTASLAFGTVLLALGLLNLGAAGRLQGTLNHGYALGFAQAALRAPLAVEAGPSRRLRAAIDDLLRRADIGFRFVAVRNAEGILLARAGELEDVSLPWLPAAARETVRRFLYRLTGSYNGGRVLAGDGRMLGSVEYSLADGVVRAVRDEALDQLRLSGWLAAGVGMLLLGFGLHALRGRPREAPAWTQRLDAARTPAASPVATGVPLVDLLRQRAGGALDALQYGLISADRDGRVRGLNVTAERMTGWPPADARNRVIYSVFHPQDDTDEPMVTAAEAALREGRDQPPLECRLRGRDGSVLPIEMMACLVRDGSGAVEGVALLFRDTSVRARTLDELRRQSRLSLAVVDHLDEGVLMTDPAGVVRFANARSQRMFGYGREELEGFTVTKLMPVPFLNTPGIKLTDYVAAKSAGKLPKVVGWRKDATTFPVELWVQPMKAEGSDGLVVIVRDISERLRGENLATRLGRLLDSALEEVYIFDAHSLYFLEVNRGARRNLGYRPEALSRMTPLDISSDLDSTTFQGYLGRLRGGELDHLIYRCTQRRQDGTLYPVEVRLNFSREEEPPVFMAIAVDISERQAAEQKLNHLAHHDALTGLPNRSTLYDRLKQALLSAGRSTRMVGVYFVDMDRFKQINDTHGHEVGDQVLKVAAERIKECLRESDTVARIGGDEFVIIGQGMRSMADAEQLAQKILERFGERTVIDGVEIALSPSIGLTLYPVDEADAEELVRHADQAMYRAKQAGRARYAVFDVEVDPERKRRIELERDIHAAVALNQYELLLEPVLDAGQKVRAVLTGFAWRHPKFGRVEAAETLHSAQRAGLLADLELWLVCHVCEQFHIAGQQGTPLVPAVVDISGFQLRDPDFATHLFALLERYQVTPGMLVLALTVEGIGEVRSGAGPGLRKLVQRGVRFALRGFNGGFEQLNRDAGLPLDFVLLAPEAAAALAQGGEPAAALRRALDTARGQRRQVIATGVDTAAVREAALAAGCSGVSGPLLGAVMTARECAGWLAKQRVEPL